MSDTHEAEAPPDDVVIDDKATESPAQVDDAPSAEDRALTMGWTPKEQFKGDPARWVDAETFVKRGEEFLPFVKATNKRLERDLEKANAKMASLEKAVEQSVQHISRAEARAYERARRDLEAQLDTATEAGDIEAVRATTKEIVDLEKDVAKPAAKTTEKPGWTAEYAEAVEEWRVDNPWFETDRAMTVFAYDEDQRLAAQGVADTARLKRVATAVRAEFPHKFENPNRRNPSAVEGVNNTPRRTGKSYADLPADAKQMCDEFVRDKIITREKYVAEFFK